MSVDRIDYKGRLSAAEFARRVGRSPRTIGNQIMQGKIKSKKIRGLHWIEPAELARYRAEREAKKYPWLAKAQQIREEQ